MHEYAIGATVVKRSGNAKLGRMYAVYASSQTCPESCPLLGTCYKETGPLGIVSRSLDAAPQQNLEGIARHIAAGIRKLNGRRGHLRLFSGGDAKTPSMARIIAAAVRDFIRITGRKAFGYTHAWREGVTRNDWKGVSMLASVETPGEAKAAMEQGWAAAIVLPWKKHTTHKKFDYHGVNVLPCPAQTKHITCSKCLLCADADRLHRDRIVIGFCAHGNYAKKIIAIVEGKLRKELEP